MDRVRILLYRGRRLWEMSDKDFTQMAIGELAQIGIIDPDDVLDSVRIKVKKAYPSYFGSYYELDKVKDFLNKIENLWCIGRNGQHRYNNMDHSMMTAMVRRRSHRHRGITIKARYGR